MVRLSLGVFPNGCLQGLLDTRRANLAKTSSFWIHSSDMLPRMGIFPVRSPIWNTSSEKLATVEYSGMHQLNILLLPSSEECIRRTF